ncbi:hypothetical protein ABIC16_002296 [Sphingomonas sp. PvP055]|uniref:hypothetical protein n=1 Tax=Sphingomonas sp. PvP055 TaxID=3156391 RepID=UPI003392B268
MNLEHRQPQRQETGLSRFDEAVAQVFQEACNRFVESIREAGQHDPDNKFFIATNAIQDAWPDVIVRLYPDRAAVPPAQI